MRGYYAERYDARANIVDWDYYMILKDVVRNRPLEVFRFSFLWSSVGGYGGVPDGFLFVGLRVS